MFKPTSVPCPIAPIKLRMKSTRKVFLHYADASTTQQQTVGLLTRKQQEHVVPVVPFRFFSSSIFYTTQPKILLLQCKVLMVYTSKQMFEIVWGILNWKSYLDPIAVLPHMLYYEDGKKRQLVLGLRLFQFQFTMPANVKLMQICCCFPLSKYTLCITTFTGRECSVIICLQ